MYDLVVDEEEFGVEASVLLESLVQGQMLQAQITEHEADGVPYIQVYNLSGGQVSTEDGIIH